MFFLSFLLFCPKELSSFSCLSSMIDCCYHLLLPIYPQNFFPFHFLFLIKLLEFSATAAAAKSLQSCPTLCDPIDGSPPGSPIPGILPGVGCHFPLQSMEVKSESEVAQSCPTLSDPMDCSPVGFSVHGIFQARVLEWVAIAFSANLVCILLIYLTFYLLH